MCSPAVVLRPCRLVDERDYSSPSFQTFLSITGLLNSPSVLTVSSRFYFSILSFSTVVVYRRLGLSMQKRR